MSAHGRHSSRRVVPNARPLQPPRLQVEIVLEELPHVRLVAGSHEDELRLRRWLAHPATLHRLLDAIRAVMETMA